MNTPGPTYETTLAQAVKHFHAGRLAEAHQLCLQLLAMDRNQPDGLRLMGLLMFRAGHLPAAVQWLGKAVSFRTDAGDFHADLARVFRAMGDQTAAVASFRRALQNNPTDLAATRVELSAVHFSRALVNAKTQKLDEAAAEFSASLELNPDHADAWYGLGGVLLNQGKHEDAVAAFRRLVALRPNETAFHMLAAAYSGLDDLDSVIAAAEAAARIAPLSVNAHVNLGLQLWSGGDLLRAREAFRAALSLDPSNQAAHSKLVYMQLADDSLSPGQILDAHLGMGIPADRRHHTDAPGDERSRPGSPAADWICVKQLSQSRGELFCAADHRAS